MMMSHTVLGKYLHEKEKKAIFYEFHGFGIAALIVHLFIHIFCCFWLLDIIVTVYRIYLRISLR